MVRVSGRQLPHYHPSKTLITNRIYQDWHGVLPYREELLCR
jgi:hypothetical protein